MRTFARSFLGHFGAPTAGANGNVRPVLLPGGYALQFTGLKVTNYDGTQYRGRGIRPHVPIERTIAGVVAGRDEVLERALEHVGGQDGGRRR